MKCVITAKELSDKGKWQAFCELKGINEWAIAEGLMNSSEEFTLTFEEARKLNLIPDN